MTLHATQFLEQGKPVLAAHEDVQEDQIRLVVLEIGQGLGGRLEGSQVHIERPDAEFVQGDRRGAVVDDDNLWVFRWHQGNTNPIVGRHFVSELSPLQSVI